MFAQKIIPTFVAIVLFIFLNCTEDPYTKGTELFNQGNYDAALDQLLAAHQEQKNNSAYLEILSLTYMYKGQLLFTKTKNVKAFLGNYKKATKLIPVSPTPEFNKKHSAMLYTLVHALLDAKERNNREKDKFYSKAIKYLQTSIALDSTNNASLQLLSQLKEDDFNNLLDLAEERYAKANKTGNIDLYFSAEAYLQKAMLFNPNEPSLTKLKSRIQRKLLPILDDRDGLAIAVTQLMRKKEVLTLKIAIKNYINKKQKIDPYQFYLIDSRGKEFAPNKKEMGLLDFLNQKRLKQSTLTPRNSYLEGILVYKTPPSSSAHYIVYRENGQELSRKYFY